MRADSACPLSANSANFTNAADHLHRSYWAMASSKVRSVSCICAPAVASALALAMHSSTAAPGLTQPAKKGKKCFIRRSKYLPNVMNTQAAELELMRRAGHENQLKFFSLCVTHGFNRHRLLRTTLGMGNVARRLKGLINE